MHLVKAAILFYIYGNLILGAVFSKGIQDGTGERCSKDKEYASDPSVILGECEIVSKVYGCTEDKILESKAEPIICEKNVNKTWGKKRELIYSQHNSGESYIPHPKLPKGTYIKFATKLGESCEDHGEQCQTLLGSQCNGKTCQCDEESQVASQNKTMCFSKVNFLNESCYDNGQCQTPGSECRTDTEVPELRCLCKLNKFIEGEAIQNRCLEIRNETNQPCLEDIQCRKISRDNNTICGEHNFCACPPPTKLFRNRCFEPIGMGSVCLTHDECHLATNNLVVCVGNWTVKTCVCPPHYITENNSCWRVKHVGDECTETKECEISIKGGHVHCRNNLCMCDQGFQTDNSGFACNPNPTNYTHITTILIFVSSYMSICYCPI